MLVKWPTSVYDAHSHIDHRAPGNGRHGPEIPREDHLSLQLQFGLHELLRAKHHFFRVSPIPGGAAVLEAQVLRAGQLGLGRPSWFK